MQDDKPKHTPASADVHNDVLCENNPTIGVLFNERYQIVDCNAEAVRYFGFASKDDFLKGFLHLIENSIPSYQPNGRASSNISAKMKIAVEDGYHGFITELMIHGKATLFHVALKKVAYGDSFAITAYMTERSEFKEYMMAMLEVVKQDATHQGKLLQVINQVATNLITSDTGTFEKEVYESLKIIGQAVKVDRVYIWENFEQNGKLYSRQIYEWVDNVEPQQGKEFTIAAAYDDLPSFKEKIFSNQTLNGPVQDMDIRERSILEIQGIQSVLIIPIHYQEKPWGYIGFDDCYTKRTFTKEEEQALRSGGILMVSAILRNDMTKRILLARNELLDQDKLLRAVNDVAKLLLEIDQDDPTFILYQALKTLGLCVGACRVSIWRNKENEKGRQGSERLVGWNKEKAFVMAQEKVFIDYDAFLPHWQKEIRKDFNQPIRKMSEKVRSLSLLKGGKSLLLLPLFIHGDFWGHIAYVSDDEEYQYKDAEKNILRYGGMLIASAIVRNDIMDKLVEARESALASTRAKTEFLSRMSHEIRTPMNAIIGMTTLAQKSGDIKKIKQYLKSVDSSSRQLLNLINDVLDMSKIDANKLEIVHNEFNFEAMMRHVYNVIQVKLMEKKLDFRYDFSSIFLRNVISDELRLSQVLINLLSNAIKFTPAYGSIILKVEEKPLDESHSVLHLEVVDNGSGIKSELLPHVFDSFEQGDGGITRKYGGSGLGLAICKQIIELMGGKIWVESELGKGSRFIVELKVEWGGECISGKEPIPLSRDLRILVVDDVSDFLEYFQNVLEGFSLTCDVATNGIEAVKMVSESMEEGNPYDVIFLDWYMPEMNGGETAVQIKRIMNDNIIVIMISGADWSDIEKEAATAGVKHFLQKPILASELYNTLIKLTNTERLLSNGVKDVDVEAKYDWKDYRILLVEDIEINREVVKGILEDTGVCIDTAENGQEAVEMFMANPDGYQLILMDVQMPVLDGLSATRRIRTSGKRNCKDIPIVAMTANAFKEDEQASYDAGMNGHITKPIDVQELYRVLKDTLK